MTARLSSPTALSRAPLLGLLALALACGDDPADTSAHLELGEEPAAEPPEPTLRRLTASQYQNSIAALFGEGLILPTSLEQDSRVDGLYSIGAAQTSISASGVEDYESAAFDVAEQVFSDASLYGRIVPCEPLAAVDDDCSWAFVESFGRRAWRRPLAEDEVLKLVDIASRSADVLGDFYQGLGYATAAILQSPYFLYRVELGELDEDGVRRLTELELATRLSYFFWNTTPDEQLLAAAEAGVLSDPQVLSNQIDRLIGDEQVRAGARAFFTEMFALDELDDLSKDYAVFEHMSPEVGPSAREETLLGLEYNIFEEDGDYRDLVTTQRTFVDLTLAAIYDIPAPEREGFGEVWLESDQGRRGLMGQVTMLAGQSHPTETSATLRGKYVRNKLLCQEIPPPPADVDASFPEASPDLPTLRDRIAVHLEDETCASCHNLTDYIGLGLENFDGIGRWRDTENDVAIDASGELDGESWVTPWEMAEIVREHERIGPCLAETMYRYAAGHALADGEVEAAEWLAEGLVVSGYSVQSLMRQLATSDAFRTVGALEE